MAVYHRQLDRMQHHKVRERELRAEAGLRNLPT